MKSKFKYTLLKYNYEDGYLIAITKHVDDKRYDPIIKIYQNCTGFNYTIGFRIYVGVNSSMTIIKLSNDLKKLEEFALLEIL